MNWISGSLSPAPPSAEEPAENLPDLGGSRFWKLHRNSVKTVSAKLPTDPFTAV